MEKRYLAWFKFNGKVEKVVVVAEPSDRDRYIRNRILNDYGKDYEILEIEEIKRCSWR